MNRELAGKAVAACIGRLPLEALGVAEIDMHSIDRGNPHRGRREQAQGAGKLKGKRERSSACVDFGPRPDRCR